MMDCSFFSIVLALWVSSVLITVYHLSYLPKCSTKTYHQCYHPFFRDEDDVHLSIHIHDSTGVQSASIWNTTRSYANLTIPETVIKIPVPSEVRRRAHDESSQGLKILFRMTKIISAGNVDGGNNGSEHEDLLLSPYYTYSTSIPITAYRKKRVISITKNLLEKSSNSSVNNVPSVSTQQEQQPLYAHHWKFGTHPLVLRVTTLGGVLQSSHINALRYDLSTKIVDSPSGRKHAYLPILWVRNLPNFSSPFLRFSTVFSCTYFHIFDVG